MTDPVDGKLGYFGVRAALRERGGGGRERDGDEGPVSEEGVRGEILELGEVVG